MDKNFWPYSDIDPTEYLTQIVRVEDILQKYGAEYIEDSIEKKTWVFKDGTALSEMTRQRIWKMENKFIRVDKLYFSKKLFLVLEFSDCIKGPYEDADPFPCNLSETELEQEVRISLGINSPALTDVLKFPSEKETNQ